MGREREREMRDGGGTHWGYHSVCLPMYADMEVECGLFGTMVQSLSNKTTFFVNCTRVYE